MEDKNENESKSNQAGDGETENKDKPSPPRPSISKNQMLYLMVYLVPLLCAYGWCVNEALRMGGPEEIKILFCVAISGVLGSLYLIVRMITSKKSKRDLLDGRTSFESLFIFIVSLVLLYTLKDFVPSEMLQQDYEKPIPKDALKIDTGKPPAKLIDRIYVTPPKMGHSPVRKETVQAAKDAVNSLSPFLRNKLDEYGASISISPNLIDKWPDAVNTLPEDSPVLNLAEQPGRIYAKEMNVYERAKLRGSTKLGDVRPPNEIKHTTLNQCVQVYDDMTGFTKEKELREIYNKEKKAIKGEDRKKLATFLKNDDWGPRETCAETGASLMGGGDEYTEGLYKCFPKTKEWLKKRLKMEDNK